MSDRNGGSLMIGGVREDYCITPDGRAISGVIGGNAIYAAVGARLWSENITIVSRIGSNFPQEWLTQVESKGINTAGINILNHPLDTRTFYAYHSLEERIDTNPVAHYQRLGLPFPNALIGYRSSTEGQDQRAQLQPATVRVSDIPIELLASIKGCHLSPVDYLTHLTVPDFLLRQGIGTITLDPSIRYMNPSFKLDLPNILQGLTAFLPSMYEAKSFFPGSAKNVWEMADSFSDHGPPIVVIKGGSSGQYLWDRDSRKRWHIPAFPTTVRDVTGAGDSFCGAFLTGLLETGDPLEATLRGNISSSIVIEGSGALYALEASPSLARTRLEKIRSMVREV